MDPHRRWVIALAVGGALLVAATVSLRSAKEAVRNSPPVASPNDNSRSAGKQSEDEILRSPGPSTDRGSSVESFAQSPPTVVFEFPDANPRLVEPATIEAFLATHPKGRYRVVTVDTDEIREVVRDKLRGVERAVEIALFPDTVIAATTASARDVNSTGIAVWSGKEVGSASITMTLAIGPDGTTMGEFITSRGMFGIDVTAQPPFHVIWQWAPDTAFGPID